MIAPGADNIIKERMRGFRPADTVVVSLVGPFSVQNPTVQPEIGKKYDWRWIKGLDVALLIASSIDWRPMAFDIKQAGPEYLCVWDIHSHRGAQVIWSPYKTAPTSPSIELNGWHFGLDYSAFHEEDNKVFWQ
jgi:hypothetical protein